MAAKEPEEKQQSSMKGMVIGIVLATLLAGGAGVLYGIALPQQKAPAQAGAAPAETAVETAHGKTKPASAHKSGKDKEKKTRAVHRLNPIIANLKQPKDRWIRLDAAVVLQDVKDEEIDKLKGKMAADILAYLRTLTLSDVEGPMGLLNLRQDIQRRLKMRAGDRVQDFLISAMVVQ
ncbi:MAG: flagellar basal body-associated FliL family protein [Hyphomicrobiales bacterium]|nr:flagellar basal body-associated FliL family protein [Hyphomicrobiales bacterium]